MLLKASEGTLQQHECSVREHTQILERGSTSNRRIPAGNIATLNPASPTVIPCYAPASNEIRWCATQGPRTDPSHYVSKIMQTQ